MGLQTKPMVEPMAPSCGDVDVLSEKHFLNCLCSFIKKKTLQHHKQLIANKVFCHAMIIVRYLFLHSQYQETNCLRNSVSQEASVKALG